ncbi:hypothetical protein ACQPZX_41985 [Actinoplanes sp. CA-142083]|uniref:hypothetical protein n=1 Tax=Actinoplanes sp. CA-142083 TaxID=3239903 RepID=UPI003D8D9751
MWTVACRVIHRGTDRAPSNRRTAVAAAVAAVCVIAGVNLYPDVLSDQHRAMPVAMLKDFDLDMSRADASPRGRQVFDTGNWTVVDTSPAPGVPTISAVLSLLKNDEAAWFAAHPTMPKLPAGNATQTLRGAGGLLAPLDELVLYRYARGKAPAAASQVTPGHGQPRQR